MAKLKQLDPKNTLGITIPGKYYSIGDDGEERMSISLLDLKWLTNRMGYRMTASDGVNPMAVYFTPKKQRRK